MKKVTEEVFERLIADIPELGICRESIFGAFNILNHCYMNGGKVLICGNGGSAADSEHIVGELMKGFMLKRNISQCESKKLKDAFPEDGEYLSANLQGALPAISLVSQSAIIFAFINDVAPDMVFAQQVYGYGKEGDVLIGISTSGSAKNVSNAVKVAKAFKISTIGLSGEKGGVLNELCDITIKVPSSQTYKIQEYHLPVYHALCTMIEMEFFYNTGYVKGENEICREILN